MNFMNYGLPMEGMESTGSMESAGSTESEGIMENQGLGPDDTVQEEFHTGHDGDTVETTQQEGDSANGQEEMEPEEKRRGRKRKVKDGDTAAAPDDGEPLSGVPEDVEESGERSGGDGPEPGDDEPDDAVSEGQPGRVRRNRPILSSSGRVIRQQQDVGQGDLSILTAARNRREILTTTLDGFEPDSSGMYQVSFMVGKVKVIIPWQEMGFTFDTETPDPIELRLRLNGMLGAIIDYMVRGVDTENRLAAASRRDAMIVRQARILNRRDGDGNYLVDVGTRCMARVLEVGGRFVRVEIFGYDLSLPITAISNLWVNDVREVVEIGREYPVEITHITRDPENGRVTAMRASMREAEEETPIELVAGNTYTGTVCSISRTAYYVHVKGIPLDVRCPIRSNYESGMMVGDFVRFYVSGVYDGRAAGAITRILKRPTP